LPLVAFIGAASSLARPRSRALSDWSNVAAIVGNLQTIKKFQFYTTALSQKTTSRRL
jgi:hypothetical protein